MTPRTLSGWITRTGLVGTDAEGRLVSVRVALRVTRGPDAGTSIELDAGSAIVGSHARCDLVLHDRAVSRQHCELLLLHGAVRVRDLGSKNGTFAGGVRVQDATLPLPFELRVGGSHVEVRAADLPMPEVSERASFGPLVGESRAMRRAFGVLERVAATDVPILFSGEPGTGKTAACAAVHQASGRRAGALLFLDPTRPLEREAIDAALRAAHGGTLILERIDEWPRHACDALVAALDARGEGMDARILSTATIDLRAAVEDGRFPRSLFFFVASVQVPLPPLRDRLEDVPALIAAIARELGHDEGAPSAAIAREVGRGLAGNVRELRALVEASLARGAAAPPSEPADGAPLSYHDAKARMIDDFERRYLEDLMARHHGVVLHAAREAGLGRNHLARLLEKHGLK